MYIGENQTAIQSQGWIADATVGLLREHPFKNISVRDICAKADLSRQTFYNLFDSKEEVLRFCLRTNYEKLYQEQQHRGAITLESAVSDFADELTTDRELIQLMIEQGLETIVADEIARCVKLFANQLSPFTANEAVRPYQEAFISGALSQIMITWFKAEAPVSVQELMAIILGICSGDFLRFT